MIGNVRPSGNQYLMEDFFYAGGIKGLMGRIREHLDLSCLTVTGRTLGENIEGAKVFNDDVIRTTANPIYGEGSLAVLKGNLAPDGCVIKPAAMDQTLPPAFRPGGGFRRLLLHEEGGRGRVPGTSRRTTSWCSATRGRRAGRACRNGACCPCRRSC